MQVRNLLTAGNFVEPLPIGLPVTLKYSELNKLDSVYIGFDESTWVQSSELFIALLNSNKLPLHINSKNGTTYVRGVLYTGAPYSKSLGNIPGCLTTEFLTKLDFVEFNFFAGHVDSTSIHMQNSTKIRLWLQTEGFNLLPGFIVPQGDIDAHMHKFVSQTTFEYDEVMGYFIFDQNEFIISYLGISLDHIYDISTYLDESGYIHSSLKLDILGQLTTSYFNTKKLGLVQNCNILIKDNLEIIGIYPISNQKSSEKISYKCPICGKMTTLEDEFTRCSDIHCLSRMFIDVNHFITRLELPEITFSQFRDAVMAHKVTKFSDILLLEPYSEIEISATLDQYLDAIIPIWAVRDRAQIWNFYSNCNGSIDTVFYYLQHPQSIVEVYEAPGLATWLQDEINIQTILEILQYTNVNILSNAKKFDGSPIFRDKNIYLTGKFIHGSFAEVSAILRSYGAEITSVDLADCIIIGDIHEDVDGYKVNKAKSLELPIFSESEFFNTYQIDDDLQ